MSFPRLIRNMVFFLGSALLLSKRFLVYSFSRIPGAISFPPLVDESMPAVYVTKESIVHTPSFVPLHTVKKRSDSQLTPWLGMFLYVNFVVAVIAYFYLYKRRKRIGFHLGMNIAMVAGGGLAIGAGVILIHLFPLHYVEVTITATVTGIVVGSLFGALFDYQTLLTGYINGLMMGIMAPMAGAAASNSVFFILSLEVFIISSFALLMLGCKTSP